MIRPLFPHLPFADDETLLSWAARLAAFHTGDVARSLLTDHAIPIAGIKMGKPDDVRRLAALGGSEPDHVLHNACVVAGERWLFRGETFVAKDVSRGPGHVCPICLVDDAGSSAVPDRTRLRERFAWRFGVVTACPKHGVALVDALRGKSLGVYDVLTAEVANHWQLIVKAAHTPSAREPTPLQQYVLQRINGRAGPGWLDHQRLDQAVKSCELLGAMMLKGPRLGRWCFDAYTLDRARVIGFDAASCGPSAIRELLSEIQRRYWTLSGSAGPGAVFGSLYSWANYPSNRQSPLAEILRTHIVETMPVGPGDMLFGTPVTERRVHSARSLASACGVTPKRLRKALIAADVIKPDTDTLDANRCVFDAETGEAVAGALVDGMTLTQLAAGLGTTLPQARALVSAGLIRPFALPDPTLGIRGFRFACHDVRGFEAALLNGAEVVSTASPGFLTVNAAARAAGQPAVKIVGAVLDGKLSELQRILAEPGIKGLRVKSDAVLALFAPVRRCAVERAT
jgi:hypothetical protein